MSERLIRRREVERRSGLKKTAIYDAVRAGTFPPPVKLGPRASAWRETDVLAWIDSRQPPAARAA